MKISKRSSIFGVICIGIVSILIIYFSFASSRVISRIAGCGHQLYILCGSYAGSNQGNYPASLDDLVSIGLIDRPSLDQLVRPSGGKGKWEYLGKNKNEMDPAFVVLYYLDLDDIGAEIKVTSWQGVSVARKNKK